MALIFSMAGCFSDSGNDSTPAGDPGISSDTISLKASTGQANGYIDLKVVDEMTKMVVSALSIDISPTTDKTDGNGGYAKLLTGLVPGNTYSIMILVDTDNDVVIDATDIGQMVTGISTGTEVNLNSLQTLKRIDVTGSTDIAMANKIVDCGIGRFNYTTQYFPDIITPGYLTFAGVTYSGTGQTSPYYYGYLPVGTYGNIFCMADMDNSNNFSLGDKYQFIPGPVVISAGDTVKTYSLGAWTVY